MKVLFLTYLPSPYRLKFFAEFGKWCELTVLFERSSAKHRDKSWGKFEFSNYEGIVLDGFLDSDYFPRLSVKQYLRKKFDHVIVHNPSTPTGIYAIHYLKHFKIPYWIESDGAFIKMEHRLKEQVKRFIYSGAYGYFSTSRENDRFFEHYGISPESIFRYPFTSLTRQDFLHVLRFSRQDKQEMKTMLKMSEHFIVLSVDRFSTEKGSEEESNSLLKVAERLKDRDIGFYIVGDVPTEKTLSIIEKLELKKVHFVNSSQIENPAMYYIASDLFIMLKKHEECGSCINEAMSFHLPVITTAECNAGSEIVRNNENGFILDRLDVELISKYITISADNHLRGHLSIPGEDVSKHCHVENRAQFHKDILWNGVLAAKELVRHKFSINEKNVILSIGRFIDCKGFDLLLSAVSGLDQIGLYIIGGNPTEAYLRIIREKQLKNVHFLPFMPQHELIDYFRCADIFVLPTHGDTWGLVINEAMRFCLPVITTYRCGAGLEMITDGVSGFLYNDQDEVELGSTIKKALNKADLKIVGLNAFTVASRYTIENMAKSHYKILTTANSTGLRQKDYFKEERSQ